MHTYNIDKELLLDTRAIWTPGETYGEATHSSERGIFKLRCISADIYIEQTTSLFTCFCLEYDHMQDIYVIKCVINLMLYIQGHLSNSNLTITPVWE